MDLLAVREFGLATVRTNTLRSRSDIEKTWAYLEPTIGQPPSTTILGLTLHQVVRYCMNLCLKPNAHHALFFVCSTRLQSFDKRDEHRSGSIRSELVLCSMRFR